MNITGDTIARPRFEDGDFLLESDAEYLERLCILGEGLILDNLKFTQAESLLVKGYAEVVNVYPVNSDNPDFGGCRIRLIAPTDRGRELVMKRKADRELKLARKFWPQLTEKKE